MRRQSNSDRTQEIAAAVAAALAKATSDSAINVAKTAADAAAALAVSTAAMGMDVKTIKDDLVLVSRELQEGFKGVHERQDRTNGRVGATEKDLVVLKTSGQSMHSLQTALWLAITTLVGLVVGLVMFFVQRGH